MKEEIKIIDGTYKKDNPHQDIGKQKFRVKKFYNVEIEYEVVANSKEAADSAVMEHGGIEKIEWQDGYYGDEPVEMTYNDHNWDSEAENDYEKYGREPRVQKMNRYVETSLKAILFVVCTVYVLWVTDTIHIMLGWPY